MTRLFVAVVPPDDVAAAVAAFVAPLRPSVSRASFVDARDYHVTCAFLGPVAERAEAISASLRVALSGLAPFAARLEGGGTFKGHTNAHWLGVPDEDGAWAALARRARKACAHAGAAAASGRFTPHLTVARSRGSDEGFAESLLQFASPGWVVAEARLMASTPGQAPYRTLERFALGAKA